MFVTELFVLFICQFTNHLSEPGFCNFVFTRESLNELWRPFCTVNLRTNLWNHLTVRNVCLSLVAPTCQHLSLDLPALKLVTAVCRFLFAQSSKSGLLVAHGSKMSAETEEQRVAVITATCCFVKIQAAISARTVTSHLDGGCCRAAY